MRHGTRHGDRVVCGNCGHDNPTTERWCAVCGTALAAPKRSTRVEGLRRERPAPMSDPGRKRRTQYDPGPAKEPAPLPSLTPDPFAAPGPARPTPDPHDPFRHAVLPDEQPEPEPTPTPALEVHVQPAPSTRIDGPTPTQQVRGVLVEYAGPDDPGTLHPIHPGRNVLGRGEGCDVQVLDGRVSGRHAYLFVQGGEVNYMDVSTNGSIVDGKPVRGEQAVLSAGSRLQLGDRLLVLLLVPELDEGAWKRW